MGPTSREVRILHVDDDPDILEVTSEFLALEDDRFDVETTSNPETVLSLLANGEYDCLVSDYEMPDMDGLDLLDEVRAEYPELPFILFTGQGSEKVASEAISAGVTDYIQKEIGTGTYTLLAKRISNAIAVREASTAASHQRHRLEQILKTVPSCVVQLDREGEFVFANRRAEEVLGLEQDDLTERAYNDPRWQIRDLDGSELSDEELPFRRVVESGEPVFDVKHRIEWPDGSERVLSVSGAPLFDGDALDSVVFTLTDITDQRRREERLARLHEASRDLYDADTVEEVAEITSQAAAQILGFGLNGVHLYDEAAAGLVPVAVTETAEAVTDELVTFDRGIAWEAFQNNEVRSYGDVREADNVYDPDTEVRSGMYFPLGRHGAVIINSRRPDDFDEADLSLGRLLAANATTALDRLERESLLRDRSNSLAKQNRQLDEFVSVVAHDLRNPVSATEGAVQLARETGDFEHLERATRTLERMEELIDDLLVFARQGETVSDTELVSLEAVTREAWESVPGAAATVRIETDARVRADPSRLRQLLVNLLGNAVEHGGETVTVTVGESEDGFYVADDGPGIPAEEREQIFESGYSTSSHGTGFGLSIVRQIVDAHGWEVTVSASEDGGARFDITGVE